MVCQDRLVSAGSPPPQSLPACLSLLWRGVLFPGAAAPASPWRWSSFFLLLIVPGVLLYPCLSFRLFEPDEGRYAQIPREMLERGAWIVPTLQGEPYLDKPPLFYWLVMLCYRVFGIHDGTARLVPALAVHGCVLLIYGFGRRCVGERPAFWGALTLTLAPAFLGMGRLVLLDSVLAFLVTLALFSAWEAFRGGTLHRGWWLLSALACGLGILTKGPIAVVLLVPPLWLHRRLAGPGARIRGRDFLQFVGAVFVVTLPWYAAVCWRLPAFAGHFLWQHNVVRFLAPFDHIYPVWYYLPILLAGFMPAMLLMVPWLRFLLSSREEARQGRSTELGFLLLAGGWCLLFFSLSGSKLPTYILPAFPFLALAFGVFLARTPWRRSRWTLGGAALGFALLLAGHYALVPWIAHVRSPMNRPEEVRAYCGDPRVPVICYPRPIDSVAFYLGRSDFRSYRSKQTPLLVQHLQAHPRTVVLFSHRHSLQQLRDVLPGHLRLTAPTKLGLCDMAVVERIAEDPTGETATLVQAEFPP